MANAARLQLQHAGSVKILDITLNCANQCNQIRTRPVKFELTLVIVLYMEYTACTPSITNTVTISTSDSQTCMVDLVVDTGSSGSILPYSTYAWHFSNVVLSKL